MPGKQARGRLHRGFQAVKNRQTGLDKSAHQSGPCTIDVAEAFFELPALLHRQVGKGCARVGRWRGLWVCRILAGLTGGEDGRGRWKRMGLGGMGGRVLCVSRWRARGRAGRKEDQLGFDMEGGGIRDGHAGFDDLAQGLLKVPEKFL